MVFPRKRIVLFVDGCFWHGCPECGKSPEQSGEFWVRKIKTNKERDQRITTGLKSEGWTVIRIPEHAVRTKAGLAQTTDRLIDTLKQAESSGIADLDGGGGGV